jgi:ferredoxin
MKVHVHAGRCQGHNNCVRLSPDLFEMDQDGYAHVRGDGTVPTALHEVAALAVANCPEAAIELNAD